MSDEYTSSFQMAVHRKAAEGLAEMGDGFK
jgi:hypothetical protein